MTIIPIKTYLAVMNVCQQASEMSSTMTQIIIVHEHHLHEEHQHWGQGPLLGLDGRKYPIFLDITNVQKGQVNFQTGPVQVFWV